MAIKDDLKEKFETKEHNLYSNRYGCWNNKMDAFQYISEWESTHNSDFGIAMLMTIELNKQHLIFKP